MLLIVAAWLAVAGHAGCGLPQPGGAQAIGRLACVITGEAMGNTITSPFGFAYTSPNAIVPKLGAYYIPMPVYVLLANLCILGLL